MTETFFLSIVATGFTVAFAHAAIPTHWLPFVMAGRGQRWSKSKTVMVTVLCGFGHVLFTTLLGILVVWLGIETSKWTGNVFPWIAGGALVAFGVYYLYRQWRGEGHGHGHFFGGHSHDDHSHDDHSHDDHSHGDHRHGPGGHDHATDYGADQRSQGDDAETKRIDTGHGVLLLEVFGDGVPPRFRVRTEGTNEPLPRAAAVSVKTVRPDGRQQTFAFAERQGYLESIDEIPELHKFTANFSLSHGSHAHDHEVAFANHAHAPTGQTAASAHGHQRIGSTPKSDKAVILGLLTLLTFSPCEGFLPVYLSGISYGWTGFVVLSAVLAVATISGMAIFTWLMMSGIERLPLGYLERYESGILGTLILFLGVGIIFLGF